MKKKLKVLLIALILLSFPAMVLAQQLLPPNNTSLPGNSRSTFTEVFDNYLRIILGIVGILAVAFLIYGGFQYMTAGSNSEQSEGAKKTIQNSIIGLVVIILSYIIVSVVINALLPGGRGV
jgi:amino acid transporter